MAELVWQRAGAGTYISWRYQIVRHDAGWTLSVLGVRDSEHSSLSDAKLRAQQIEDMRVGGDDPYWGGRPRFYAAGRPRKNVRQRRATGDPPAEHRP